MSARAVTLWFIDTDDPVGSLRAGVEHDVTAAQRLASSIYGDNVLLPMVDTTLAEAMNAGDAHVYAGYYGRLCVVSCSLFATVRPAELTRTVASIRQSAAATLLHTDPDSGIGAFARWENGELKRSFSATPVDIFDDQGLPYPFERPFWAGEQPLHYAAGVSPDPLALPFHPQQLAEESNRAWLGFRFTHPLAPTDIDPAAIPVTGYAIHPADYVPTVEDDDRYRAASRGARPGDQVPQRVPGADPAAAAGPVPGEPIPDAETVPAQPRKRGRLARYFGFGGEG
ncbi:hypothetical protein GYA93_12130 [Gordonia desulfuricans]|uniref:Uncharacterized protein n=1 Tax=Gordonia desulfuricans TaxID=89051 RepID=A0A7K3LQ11_9ACTN|nr:MULTISPECIES: hypothetical protein [Gordonia]KOY49835.1 hypothetical protein ISGA_07625 [Gordonia sp. NB41Y]NDK90325.1 hypothetical protein [Gordonia desulfuricans]WLP89581.1 hypothetical protein Q9K23_18755 [Gordonia sp. NB41Y]